LDKKEKGGSNNGSAKETLMMMGMGCQCPWRPLSFCQALQRTYIFQCAITSNIMMSFEAFSYPTSLHSLTNNVLEEESRYKNPLSGLRVFAHYNDLNGCHNGSFSYIP
jgi:hypothetical protein